MNIYDILSETVPKIRDKFGMDQIRDALHYTSSFKNFKAIVDDLFFEFADIAQLHLKHQMNHQE